MSALKQNCYYTNIINIISVSRRRPGRKHTHHVRSAAVYAAGAQPDEDPPRTEESDDTMEAVVGLAGLARFDHDHVISHGGQRQRERERWVEMEQRLRRQLQMKLQ